MTRLRTGALAIAVATLLPLSALLAQVDSTLRVDRIMTDAELQETGVSSLAPAQRAALEAWLTRYALAVATLARQAQVARTSVDLHFEPTPQGLRVREVADGGGTVVLDDGSVWKIELGDRPRTITWQQGDYVLVRVRPAPTGGNAFVLVNSDDEDSAGDRNTSAAARFGGRRSEGMAPR
jgi:hypothetical protein